MLGFFNALNSCHTLFFAILCYFFIYTLLFLVILSFRSKRSIHKFKVWICVFKACIFYLKFKVCLKFCGYFANAQYDNMNFLLFAKAQNDKTLVILSFRKKAKYP